MTTPDRASLAYLASQRTVVEAELQCKHCGAQNWPGHSYVVIEPNERAFCIVCSHSGHVSTFQPQGA